MGPHLTLCRLSRAYLRTKWHIDPSSRLATIHGPKFGGCCAHLLGGELGPHLTQCRLVRAYLRAKFEVSS